MPDTPGRSRPAATVIVCTHDRPALLDDCVTAIAADLLPVDELVVVESAGTGAASLLAALPGDINRRLWMSQDPRKTANLNAVIGAGTHEAVLLTDDDCRVAPGWVAAMSAALTADPGIAVAFGPVVGLSTAGAPLPWPGPGPAPIENWNYAHGASMAVRRSAFMAVCGFDERFGPGTPIGGGEEADLVVRLAVEGGRCVLADAPPVQHRAWRDAAADRANVTVYQRAAGAWVGAALRRAPVRSAKVAALRVRHELGWWRDPGHRGWTLGPRLSGAFLAGLATGVTLAPRRHRP